MCKYRLSLLLTIVICSIANAQQITPQNVRKITVTNQYVLENGNKTAKFWAVYQEMYDSLGRLHTETEYDFITHQLIGYKWHTFKGKQLVKSQIFSNEKLKMVKEYIYNSDSLVFKEIITTVKPGDTSKYLTITYTYNKFKKPILIEARSVDGRMGYTSKYTYDAKGTEITRKVKLKKELIPSDSILQQNCKPQYDSIGQLKNINISTVKYGKDKALVQNYFYSYNTKGQIIGITIKNEKGELVARIEKIYDTNKHRIQQLKYYNSANTLVKWLAYRYELYRSKDLRFREIDY